MKSILKPILFFLIIACQLHVVAQEKPNVIMIIVDDLNDYQGAFGGHKQAITPNIDKLAASGVQFINAQTNVPVCQPSRNSLFTGVYPHVSKDFGWTSLEKQPVLKNNKTIVGFFKENGYLTLGSGKLTHKKLKKDWDEWGASSKHNYGPFFFNGTKTVAHPSVPKPYSNIGAVDGSYGRFSDAGKVSNKKGEKGWVYGYDKKVFRYVNDNDRDLLQDEKHAQWAVKKISELETKSDKKPFFMGLGFVRPHTPLHAVDKYFDMFPLDEIELDNWLPNDDQDTYWKNNFDVENSKGSKYYRQLLKSYDGDRELAMKKFLQAYLACIAFVDDQIGLVLDALNKSELKDNTIVVLTSDHGWQMGEKNYLFKNSPWEESARVPLVIRVPKGTKGVKVKHPVSLIDIFPTLIDYCSLKGAIKKNENGADLSGFSLKPFIEKPETNCWKGPNGALTVVGNFLKTSSLKEKQNYSYRTENFRYILYSNGKEELYDHRNDPYEWDNLAYNDKFKRNKKSLNKEMQKIINKK